MCPTMMTAVAVVLAKRTSSAVHSRSCETAPALAAAADCTVWIESIDQQRRALCVASAEDGRQVGLGHQSQGRAAQPRRWARRPT